MKLAVDPPRPDLRFYRLESWAACLPALVLQIPHAGVESHAVCMQEGAEATCGAGPTNMKQAAATLWGSDSWRQRSLKPEALSEWQGRCSKAAAQGPTKSAQLGSSSSRPARCPEAGEREEAPRAHSFPAADKPNSPYNSVVSP